MPILSYLREKDLRFSTLFWHSNESTANKVTKTLAGNGSLRQRIFSKSKCISPPARSLRRVISLKKILRSFPGKSFFFSLFYLNSKPQMSPVLTSFIQYSIKGNPRGISPTWRPCQKLWRKSFLYYYQSKIKMALVFTLFQFPVRMRPMVSKGLTSPPSPPFHLLELGIGWKIKINY